MSLPQRDKQGGEDSHRGRILRAEVLRDGKDELLLCSEVSTVATMVVRSIRPCPSVSHPLHMQLAGPIWKRVTHTSCCIRAPGRGNNSLMRQHDPPAVQVSTRTVVMGASLALATASNLGAHPDPLSDLDARDVLPDLGNLPDDFVSRHHERRDEWPPATRYGVVVLRVSSRVGHTMSRTDPQTPQTSTLTVIRSSSRGSRSYLPTSNFCEV